MNQLEIGSGFPWQDILDKLLDRVSNSAGAMHHVALGNKFENWLQVEFVGVLLDHQIDPQLISMEKRSEPQVRYPYWDVVVGMDRKILVDLKVLTPKSRSVDVTRIADTIKRSKEMTSPVWFLLFGMGVDMMGDEWCSNLRNELDMDSRVGPSHSEANSSYISICAVQMKVSQDDRPKSSR